MSSVTTNPASLVSAGHRAQLVAEAVVSTYIHDISRPQRPREHAAIRRLTSQQPSYWVSP